MVSLILLLALPIFVLFLLQKYKRNSAKKLPPGPPGLPIIGNLHQLDNEMPYYSLWKFSNKYGPLMSLRLGFLPTLVVSSARMAEEVFKTHDINFSGRPSLIGQQKLSYGGLDMAWTPYGQYWREIRKVCVVNLFSSKRVQSFRPAREDEVSRLIAKITKNAVLSEITNLSDLAITLTSSMICRVAFGKRYEEDGQETRRFHALVAEAQVMLGTLFFQDMFPYMGCLDKLNGMHRRLEKNFKEADVFYQEIIDEHVDPKRPKSNVEDFVDILLDIKNKDHLFSNELTWDHIKGVLMNVFIAGTDTGAASIVWAMTLMMKNPSVLKKVQEEIRTVIGNKGVVEEDDIQKLPYFNSMVKETMRLHPATPLLVQRETLEHCIIDGYDIEPRTLVFINAWAIGRDPEVWEKPYEFDPERFMGKSIDFKGQDYELVPFGSGRRICPGLHLGVATVELALSNILYSFNWKLPPGVKPEDIDMSVLPGITMHKKVPLCLVAEKYEYN